MKRLNCHTDDLNPTLHEEINFIKGAVDRKKRLNKKSFLKFLYRDYSCALFTRNSGHRSDTVEISLIVTLTDWDPCHEKTIYLEIEKENKGNIFTDYSNTFY